VDHLVGGETEGILPVAVLVLAVAADLFWQVASNANAVLADAEAGVLGALATVTAAAVIAALCSITVRLANFVRWDVGQEVRKFCPHVQKVLFQVREVRGGG
jgi:hypothetical protein